MDKKEKIKIIIISSIISSIFCCIFILILSGKTDSLSINDFKTSDIDYTLEETNYSKIYRGESKITCDDKTGTYLLIYSEKLISGGTYEKIGQTNYYECIVHNGEGTITTYDYCSDDNTIQPQYEIQLLGYRSFY